MTAELLRRIQNSRGDTMGPDFVVAFTLPALFGWFAWLVFSAIRRFKIAKLQAEVQQKLIEKFVSGQELLAYAQTDAGRQLLESLRVETISPSPYNRIIGALQAGIVMILLGAALLVLYTRPGDPDAATVFFRLGTIISALGIGFALSAAASYYLSKSFGLLNGGRA
jgi:hypothetical protein